MEETKSIREQRIDKLNALTKLGIDAYGSRLENRDKITDLLANFADSRQVCIAGRIIALRLHGKSIFANIISGDGAIQIYIKEGAIGRENFELFSKFDIGDIISCTGLLFKTRTGEITVNVSQFIMLSKSLRPLPEKWHGLKDIEIRYRQRYLDLIANEDVKKIFLIRSKIVTFLRDFLDSRDYIEVETPIMQSLPGGAAGEPFKTHHKTFDADLYLRLAPELYLKRLIVGGFEKVYEIGRSFRNEGVSTRHNPEFTMLEAYTAYADYTDMMKLTEELITEAACSILGKKELEFKDKKINLNNWEKVSFAKLMEDNFDIMPDQDVGVWIKKLQRKGVKIEGEDISRSFVINIIEDMLTPEISNHPVFVTDMYTELCPLAKTKKDNPLLSERFELFIGGMEIANAYSELNDPIEQKARFKGQLKNFKGKDKNIDQDFVLALEQGMPPTGGLGIGIDRLVMLFTNQASIRDVIFFPQLKPEK